MSESSTTSSSLFAGFKEDSGMKNNFALMCGVWVMCSLSYYIINFYMKYLDGSIFVNTHTSAMAKVVATLTAGFFFVKFGLKIAMA